MQRDPQTSVAERVSASLKGSERRSAARKQKEALFYSSGERKRMQSVMYLLGGITLLSLLANIVLGVSLAFALNAVLHIPVVGLVEHDNGRPTTVLGELTPLHGDATSKTLQWNAEHYIADLMTRTTFEQLTINKESVLKRTSAGSEAETFVQQQFAKLFKSYERGTIQAQHIDCRPEGGFAGPASQMRFDCYYELVPIDGVDAAARANNPSGVPTRYLSHIEIAQERGIASYIDFLYANPDEVLVSYVDQENLDEGADSK